MLVWLLAPVFGALYGMAELMPRYRDAPLRALSSWSGAIYIVTNAAASLGALAVVRALQLDLGFEDRASRDVAQVLVAGFGAMAAFRSSVFIARVGDSDVPIGPITVLRAVLDMSDRGVDRKRAADRALDIAAVMKGVTLDQAVFDLPQLAFGLMQNVADDEQVQAAAAAQKILRSDLKEQTKIHLLGLGLMRITGRRVLVSAIALLLPPSAEKLSSL